MTSSIRMVFIFLKGHTYKKNMQQVFSFCSFTEKASVKAPMVLKTLTIATTAGQWILVTWQRLDAY